MGYGSRITHGTRVYVRTGEDLAVPSTTFRNRADGEEVVVRLAVLIDHLVGFRYRQSTRAKNRSTQGILVWNNVTAVEEISNERTRSRSDIGGWNASVDNDGQFPTCPRKRERTEAKPAGFRVPLEMGLRPAVRVDDSGFD